MIYKLDKQIWNERIHNMWIWIEMFVVSVVLWYVIDSLYVIYSIYNQPKGQNIEHTYQIMTDILLPSNPDYVSPEISQRSSGQDLLEIANRLRQREDIESVCISMYASPYNNNYNIDNIRIDSNLYLAFLIREVSPDYFKVFCCEPKDEKPIDEIIQSFDNNGGVVISTEFVPDSIQLKAGDNIYHDYSDNNIPIAGVLKQFKQIDFKEEVRGQLYKKLTDNNIVNMNEAFSRILEISVRVKPEKEAGFAERILNDADNHYRVGNRFIKTVRSMELIRQVIQLDKTVDVRNRLIICGFLLINIFFGLLGTFWFRTQQRRKEMALHIVIGCSQKLAFNRLIIEGLFLLIIATIPALFVDSTLAIKGFTDPFLGETFAWDRFVITTSITFGCMCLIAIIGIAIPALQCRKLDITTILQEN